MEFTEADVNLLVHCAHNALWLQLHPDRVRTGDHLLVLNARQVKDLEILLGSIMRDRAVRARGG
jgi:hypothetical protein